MTAEERFAALAEEFAGRPGVELPGAPGNAGLRLPDLKVANAIFARSSSARR